MLPSAGKQTLMDVAKTWNGERGTGNGEREIENGKLNFLH